MTLSYNKLWKLLIDKNIKKTQLWDIAGINSNVVAKLGRDESVPLKTIVKICEALNCDIGDVVELKKEEI